MRRFVAEFERVFADELAALAVAGGCQRLKVEAATRQWQYLHPRRIQQHHRVLRHPSRRYDPAQTEVALIGADTVAVGRITRRISPYR